MEVDQRQGAMNFTENQQGCAILDRLRSQKATGLFCDVVFHIKDQPHAFEAHRNVLAACSPYFESMLQKNKVAKEHVTVACKNHLVFEILLDYIYTGKVLIYKECVYELLKLANHYLLSKLKSNCGEYLERNIDIANCLSVKDIAEECGLPSLAKTAESFIVGNMHHVIQQDEILDYPLNRLEFFIGNKIYGLSPEMKLHLISMWVRCDPSVREVHFGTLLEYISWKDINSDVLHLHLTNNLLLQERDLCKYHLLKILHSNNLLIDVYVPMMNQLQTQFEQPEPPISGNNILELAVSSAIGKLNHEQLDTEAVNSQSLDTDMTNHEDGDTYQTYQEDTCTDIPDKESMKIGHNESSRDVTLETQDVDNNVLLQTLKEKRKRKGTPKKIKVTKEKTKNGITNDKESPKKRGRPKRITLKINKIGADLKVNQTPTKRKLPNRKKKVLTDKHCQSTSEQSDHDLQSDDDAIGDDHQSDEDFVLDLKNCSDEEYENDFKNKGSKSEKRGRPTKERQEKIPCPSCNFIANSATRLEHHMMTAHKDDTTYTCNICEYETTWNREYYMHMKEHFTGPPYRCDNDNCDYSADRIQPLLYHRMIHTDERPFQCTICNYKFRTKNNLTTHLRCHTGEKPFKCPICDRSFATKGTMEQHLVTHSDVRPYLCDQCGFSTKYQSHLISHKRIHTGDVFKCDHPNCNYFTPKRSQLNCHMRTHLSVRSHVCNVCGRAFVEKSHLVRHERIHLKDKPFKCVQCEYSSTRRDKLKEHMLKHHGDSSNSKLPYKPRKQRRQTYDPLCFPGISPVTAALASATGVFPLKMPPGELQQNLQTHQQQLENQQVNYHEVGLATTIDPHIVGITLNARHPNVLDADAPENSQQLTADCKQDIQNVQPNPVSESGQLQQHHQVVDTGTTQHQHHQVVTSGTTADQQGTTTTAILQPVDPHLQLQPAQQHYTQPEFSLSTFMSMF